MSATGWKAKLKLTVLSPIHIGTGERLAPPDMEFEFRDNKVVRLDIDGFLSDQSISIQDKERYFSANRFDKTVLPLRSKIGARYTLSPGSGKRLGSEVREMIKLVGDKPYLPGSSVKGAIRTALAWNLFAYLTDDEKNLALESAGSERREKFKGTPLEKMLFAGGIRGDAKADALKSLVVRDSVPIEGMQFFLYDLYKNHSGRGDRDRRGPFGLESIPVGTEINIDVKMDGHFLTPNGDYKPSEYASGALLDPKTFAGAIRHFGNHVSKIEREFFGSLGHMQVAAFFERDNLLPIGFGTGWNTKTIGTFLKPQQIEQAKITFRRGHPPPISRRVAIDKDNNPVLPLGWVQFEMELI